MSTPQAFLAIGALPAPAWAQRAAQDQPTLGIYGFGQANTVTPVTGEALPIFGMSAYLDHNWSSKWSSALGYARVDVKNSDLQAPTAFKVGQYASGNLLCTPVKNAMMGGEFQWANFSVGFSTNDYRLQFSFKYSFSPRS